MLPSIWREQASHVHQDLYSFDIQNKRKPGIDTELSRQTNNKKDPQTQSWIASSAEKNHNTYMETQGESEKTHSVPRQFLPRKSEVQAQ
jgi:hypothetical protein